MKTFVKTFCTSLLYLPSIVVCLNTSVAQDQTEEADTIKVAPLYQESLRPQFHFTARQWTVHKLNPVIRPEPPHGG